MGPLVNPYPPIYEFTAVNDPRKNNLDFVNAWYQNHGYALQNGAYLTRQHLFHVAYKHMYRRKPDEHCATCAIHRNQVPEILRQRAAALQRQRAAELQRQGAAGLQMTTTDCR